MIHLTGGSGVERSSSAVIAFGSESVLIHFGGPRAYFAQFVCFAFVIGSHPF